MGRFDSFDYDINKRLPEWWKNDGLNVPVNEYTQDLIAEILESLLSNTGVVQPLNCWLTIPEEYTWYHHYKPLDDYLTSEGSIIVDGAVDTLFPQNKIVAKLPNTKRNCHAKIQLKLLGSEIDKNNEGEIEEPLSKSETIPKLILENAGQQIIFRNIPSVSTIEILTEGNEILIDDEYRDDLVTGSFNKIRPVIKNPTCEELYIDENSYKKGKITEINFTDKELKNKNIYLAQNKNKKNKYQILFIDDDNKIKKSHYYVDINSDSQYVFYNSEDKKLGTGTITTSGKAKKNLEVYKPIPIEDENKKTEIKISIETNNPENTANTKTLKEINFDLQIYLYKPTYTTEQNIRIASVSAFPIEWVKLYGYYCHPFNNQRGYKELWSQKYTKDSRTVYDRISKQFDCEKFYVEVKFHGIGTSLKKGFPQEIGNPDKAFQPNPNLDKWGKIYGLQRRIYRNDITEDEEPYTFPKYYKYPIEQDYWYEERMVNEYRYEADAVDSLFVRDSDFNNIGMLECIYPFTNNIWVYTETINPSADKTYSKSKKINKVSQNNNETMRATWSNTDTFPIKPLTVTLEPSPKNKVYDNMFYETKTLNCSFCLNEIESQLPQDIEIKGIELKLQTEVSMQSSQIKLSNDSKVIIPYIHKWNNQPILEKINIFEDNEIFMSDKGYYTIGSPTNLFREKEITREQLFFGNDGKLDFELIFVNENTFLESILYIKDITLNIYYEIIQKDYDIEVKFDKKQIVLSEEGPHQVTMNITIENKSQTEIKDKELFIIIPPELKFLDNINAFTFNLDVDEVIDDISVPIALKTSDEETKTGLYDILVFCEDKVISNEILITQKMKLKGEVGKNDSK